MSSSDLKAAILKYICECQVEGDFLTLQRMGIPNQVLDMLNSMTIQEILHVTNMQTEFVTEIQFDVPSLERALLRSREARREQWVRERMIALGAPLQLLKRIAGLTPQEFSNIRKMQNIEVRGRTQLPTMEQEQAVYDTCRLLHIDPTDPDAITGEEWIELAQRTDLPIRLIYRVLCENEDERHEQVN